MSAANHASALTMASSTKPNYQCLAELAVKPTFRTIEGVSIRFTESAPRDTDALLLSPWPESIFAYEAIWPQLAETTHLVLIFLGSTAPNEKPP